MTDVSDFIMYDEPGLRRDMYSGTLGKLWSKDYGLISLPSRNVSPVSITNGYFRTVTVMRTIIIVDQHAPPVGQVSRTTVVSYYTGSHDTKRFTPK